MHFSTKLSVAAAFAAVANALTVNSPAALIQCQPVSLSWSGSTNGPFFVALIPGGEASAAPLADLGSVQSSPLAYTVAIAAGTSVTIKVTDQSGEVQYSDPITVQDSSNTSCLNGGSASGSSSADSSASATGSQSGSATGSQSGSATPTGSSSASTSSPNAGSALQIGSVAGVAGIIAAVMGVVA